MDDRLAEFFGHTMPKEVELDGHEIVEMLDLERIKTLIPERGPALFVDRAVILNGGDRLQCVATAEIKEASCAGHMPGMPILPLATASWMLSQSGEILVAYESLMHGDEDRCPLVVEVGKVNSRYRDFLLPGDRMILLAVRESYRFTLWTVAMKAWLVSGKEILDLPGVKYVAPTYEDIKDRIAQQMAE